MTGQGFGGPAIGDGPGTTRRPAFGPAPCARTARSIRWDSSTRSSHLGRRCRSDRAEWTDASAPPAANGAPWPRNGTRSRPTGRSAAPPAGLRGGRLVRGPRRPDRPPRPRPPRPLGRLARGAPPRRTRPVREPAGTALDPRRALAAGGGGLPRLPRAPQGTARRGHERDPRPRPAARDRRRRRERRSPASCRTAAATSSTWTSGSGEGVCDLPEPYGVLQEASLGLHSEPAVSGTPVPVSAGEDQIAITMGPVRLSGSKDEWAKTLGPIEGEIGYRDQPLSVSSRAWDRPVLDIAVTAVVRPASAGVRAPSGEAGTRPAPPLRGVQRSGGLRRLPRFSEAQAPTAGQGRQPGSRPVRATRRSRGAASSSTSSAGP